MEEELNNNIKEISIKENQRYKSSKLHLLTEKQDGEYIKIFGWVTKCNALKKFTFVELTSHFKTVKCIINKNVNLTFSTTITVYGKIVRCDAIKDKHTFEIHIDDYEIYNGELSPPFPLNKFSNKESFLDYGHLWLRLPERSLFLQARSELLYQFRSFYRKFGYTEVTTPTIVQTQVEGGSTLFKLDYYGENAYLTQTSQLYLETVVPVAGKAYCIMPSYRAEKSKTSRHLSEYTHVEGELVDITFDELIDSIEQLIRYVVEEFYNEMLEKIREVYPGFNPIVFLNEPFKRIKYKDAIKYLQKNNILRPDGNPYEMMDDIADITEKYLVESYGKGQPVFLTHFPTEHKPFYMKNSNGTTESCDLLFPNIGEVAGASMRLNKSKELLDGFRRENINTDPYSWYLDMSSYGPSEHGGYGIGFERIMMSLMHYNNVDESTLYPRKVTRCQP